MTTKKITFTALLLAINLGFRSASPSITIIAGVLNVNPSIILLPIIGMLVGKNHGFFVGIVSDLISFALNPTIFNPIFTLNEGLLCYLGGHFFYKEIPELKKIVIYSFITCYLGIVVMNTLALTFQYALLDPDIERLQRVLSVSLFMRICSSTFIYIPLLCTILYLPRKQWEYLKRRWNFAGN
jgi:Protein of unknown function (DUF1393).